MPMLFANTMPRHNPDLRARHDEAVRILHQTVTTRPTAFQR